MRAEPVEKFDFRFKAGKQSVVDYHMTKVLLLPRIGSPILIKTRRSFPGTADHLFEVIVKGKKSRPGLIGELRHRGIFHVVGLYVAGGSTLVLFVRWMHSFRVALDMRQMKLVQPPAFIDITVILERSV